MLYLTVHAIAFASLQIYVDLFKKLEGQNRMQCVEK